MVASRTEFLLVNCLRNRDGCWRRDESQSSESRAKNNRGLCLQGLSVTSPGQLPTPIFRLLEVSEHRLFPVTLEVQTDY